MRRLYLFIAMGCLLIAFTSSSQCTIRTVTTKWNATGTSNTWDWTTQFYTDAYIKNRTSNTIPSPFYNPNSTFQNPNLIFLQNAAVKDLDPDDGWELLVKDFGNNSNLPATAVSNPFFALYNRHLGLIRAFFLVVDPLSGTNNGATMSLMFEGGSPHNETALLSFASPIVKPLDQFEKNVIVRVPNKYSNEFDYWLFADFPVSYDPCTCLFQSQLTFTVQLIQTTNASLAIKLTGGLTGTVKQIIKAAPDGVESGLFSNSALNWVNGVVKSGNEGYKSWTSFKDAGLGFMDYFIKQAPEKAKVSSELSDLTSFFSNIPYVGGVLGVFDFLIGGGRKSATSAGPMAMQANLKLDVTGTADGKLELSTVRGYRTINTPGSQATGSGSGTPTYDNVLGVFALLETPKIEYIEFSRAPNQGIGYTMPNPGYDPNCVETPDDPYACYNNYPTISSEIGIYDTKIRQYKLAAPIKYAINPAANLNLIDIKAALVIYDSVIDYSGALGASSGWNFPATFDNVNAYSSVGEKLNNMGYEYETEKKFRTAFVPLSCISNTSIAECLGMSQGVPLRNPTDVYLKINATFRRQNATSTTQDVIFVTTYKTTITHSALDPGNLVFYLNPTGRTAPDGTTLPPYEYPNVYYFTASQTPFPSPIAGIAGVQNPNYPAICSGAIPAPQTDAQITAFCNDNTLYNHIATQRAGFADAFRPKEPTNSKEAEVLSLTNSPNPFAKQTLISFNVPKPGLVRLSISDQSGKVLKILVNRQMQAGKQSLLYNSELTAGLYYCTLEIGGLKVTKKILAIK